MYVCTVLVHMYVHVTYIHTQQIRVKIVESKNIISAQATKDLDDWLAGRYSPNVTLTQHPPKWRQLCKLAWYEG